VRHEASRGERVGQVSQRGEQDDAGVLAKVEGAECLSELGARAPPGRDCGPAMSCFSSRG